MTTDLEAARLRELAMPGEAVEELFIPHGQRCEADDGRGTDFGRCSDAATTTVIHEGIRRYVCHFHFVHYRPKEQPK